MKRYLMSGDRIIAEFNEQEKVKIIKKELVPFYLLRTGNIRGWIESRAIDDSRINSRLLKKHFGISKGDNYLAAMHMNAATITDNYWIQDEPDNLKYSEIQFHKNDFANLALYGDYSSFNLPNSRTPEFTNIGSFEKCWRKEGDVWWLYKAGTDGQIFSECFIYQLGKFWGYNMAEYEIVYPYIKTKDFTNGKVNFEPAASFLFDHEENGKKVIDEDYLYNYRTFQSFSGEIAEDYIKMCFLDALCSNADRHLQNYGILRSQSSGEILSLAPNFDNNIALLYFKNLPPRSQDGLMKLFLRFMKTEKIPFSVPPLTKEQLREIIWKIPVDVDKDFVLQYIWEGYELLKTQLG